MALVTRLLDDACEDDAFSRFIIDDEYTCHPPLALQLLSELRESTTTARGQLLQLGLPFWRRCPVVSGLRIQAHRPNGVRLQAERFCDVSRWYAEVHEPVCSCLEIHAISPVNTAVDTKGVNEDIHRAG